MDSVIYLIRNNINMKEYVGSTKTLSERRHRHWYLLRKGKHDNSHLQYSWNRYGEQAFVFLILEYCPSDDRIARENWWIDLLGTLNNPDRGYNKQRAEVADISDQTKAKMSRAKKGKPWSVARQEIGQKALEGRKRPPFTDSWRLNLSLSHKGQGAKRWKLTGPTGEVLIILNLREFCLANDLNRATMCDVSKGRRSHHKGWRVEKL
jgi:group I intron endonuclease